MSKPKTFEDLFAEKICEAFDDVGNYFLKNQASFFADQNEIAAISHKALEKTINGWKKSRRCIYRNCQNKSVRKSHTITKGTFLSEISENGHVYTPAPDYGTSRTKIKLVGINIASTFPGFCCDHEKIFFDFERSKKFDTDLDVLKQIYRTICREIVIKNFRLKKLQDLRDSYKKYRDDKLLLELKKQPFIKLIENSGKKVLSFGYEGCDPILHDFNSEIEDIENDISNFNKSFYKKIHDDIELKSNKSYFYCANISINQQLPVALAGRVNVEITERISGKSRYTDLILNVLPTANETRVFIFSTIENENFINEYLNEFLKRDFGIIELVESWMIHGSDHWFIKPSIWEKITIKNQATIVNDIVNTNDNISSIYHKTLFNDLKRELFSELKESKSAEDFQRVLFFERNKFTDVVSKL